jgi:hypothetical protein
MARLIALTIIFFGLSIQCVCAQQTVPSAGGEATGSGGSASYSVGQMLFSSYLGSNGSVTEGVQQPYEISIISGIDQDFGITLQINVFPNPASHYLTLKVLNYEKENISYKLIDSNGVLLQCEKLTGNETQLNMNGLVPAIYFLIISENSKEIRTFRIIKN